MLVLYTRLLFSKIRICSRKTHLPTDNCKHRRRQLEPPGKIAKIGMVAANNQAVNIDISYLTISPSIIRIVNVEICNGNIINPSRKKNGFQ